MADIALLRKAPRDMVRIIRVLIVRQMATHTCRTGEAKISVRMALAALHSRVKTSEWPARRRVVERGGGPVRSAVAHFTLLGETCRDVTRVVRSLVILQVTAHAGRDAEVEIPVHMAQCTCWCAPVRGNAVFEWSNDAGCQPAVVWQILHCSGIPAAMWFGLVVLW